MIATERISHIVDVELSKRGRVGHVVLLLCASAMTIGLASLWATEPALPLRTHVAFAMMVAIGGAWTAYAAWVLTTRSVLLARHRVVAAWMGVIFSTAFAVLFAAVGYTGNFGAMPYAAAGVELVLVGAAIVMLVRARQRFAQLVARRDALQHAADGARS
jgi:hypothetical protein